MMPGGRWNQENEVRGEALGSKIRLEKSEQSCEEENRAEEKACSNQTKITAQPTGGPPDLAHREIKMTRTHKMQSE
jgi:hypothetical protein